MEQKVVLRAQVANYTGEERKSFGAILEENKKEIRCSFDNYAYLGYDEEGRPVWETKNEIKQPPLLSDGMRILVEGDGDDPKYWTREQETVDRNSKVLLPYFRKGIVVNQQGSSFWILDEFEEDFERYIRAYPAGECLVDFTRVSTRLIKGSLGDVTRNQIIYYEGVHREGKDHRRCTGVWVRGSIKSF